MPVKSVELLFPSRTCFPLRITMSEWEKSFTADDIDLHIYWYDLFILRTWLEWTGNIESGGWDYCEMYEVNCRNGNKHRAFGPHKTYGLAKKKVLDFLVVNGALEIIGEEGKLID